MFDTSGSEGRLRAYPFLGTWRALLYGEVLFLERLVVICSVFWRVEDSGFKNLQERCRRISYAVRIAVDRFSPAAWLTLNIPCQAMGDERAARGDRKSGVNIYQGSSELRGALDGERNLEPRGSPFSGHRLPILFPRLQYGMLISMCTVVLLYITSLVEQKYSREYSTWYSTYYTTKTF